MPVYEYECRQCGAKNEFLETLGGGRITVRRCSACGGVRLKRVVSGFVYNRPVSLEDLGVKVNYVPQSPTPEPTGPPPGGCPYCQPATAPAEPAPPPKPLKKKSKKK